VPALLDSAYALVAPLVAGARACRAPGIGVGRVLVGIVGPPGAGKSTLAEALAARFTNELEPRLGARAAVVVPMDGFHLSNVELGRLGLTDRKGAPQTFDGLGYVHLLRRLKAASDEVVYAPAYSRVLHESIGGAIPVGPQVQLVVTEGNYLLVPEQPWSGVKALLDLSIYLDVPETARIPGLLRRQRARGLDEVAARDWVERSDEANARLVATTRQYADAVLSRG
jgi:pantothenate kinase